MSWPTRTAVRRRLRRVVDGGEAPALREPARDEVVEGALEVGADLGVDDPPRGDGVGSRGRAFVGWVDVDAAEQSGLVLVEDGVVEGLVALDLLGVALEVGSVGLVGDRLDRPAPSLAVLRP